MHSLKIYLRGLFRMGSSHGALIEIFPKKRFAFILTWPTCAGLIWDSYCFLLCEMANWKPIGHSDRSICITQDTKSWKIPWTEEPGRLQSMGSLRVGHYWMTSLSLFTFMHWRRKWQPTPVFLPGESQRWRSLVGCRLGVAQSWTRLKGLNSSSHSFVSPGRSWGHCD